MVLIAPGIARYTINATFAGEDIANIIDMQIDTTGGTSTRSEGLFAVAGDILNNWADHVVPLVSDDYSFRSVSWLDLDDASGDTGERTSTSAETLPQSGTITNGPFSANVAVLVKKQIVGTRGRRSGRMYLCGFTEDYTPDASPNTLTTVGQGLINSAMSSFLDGINDATGAQIGIQRQMVVVHTQRPTPTSEPVYNGYTPVESLIVDGRLATQRGRLR